MRKPLTIATLGLVASLTVAPSSAQSVPAVEPLPSEANWPKTWIPKRIGDRVLSAFSVGRAHEPDRRFVAASVSMPMPLLEAMGADDTVLHAREWGAELAHRSRILAVVDTMLALPEKDVDIWKVSLTLAKDTDPSLDLKGLTEDFEAIVAEARRKIPADATPDYRIRALNTLIYKRLGVGYDKTDFMGEKLVNRYAYGVVKTRHGSCVNLAEFYIALGQRLGYPIYAVAGPQHLFARYVDPSLDRQNIEPTGQGGWDPDDEYIRKMEIPERAVANGVYMRTMTYRELTAEMIADHGAFYYAKVRKDYGTAIAILERALQVSPKASEFRHLLGQVYKKWGAADANPETQEIKFTKALFYMQEAKQLGIGEPLEDGYWKKPPPSIFMRGPGV